MKKSIRHASIAALVALGASVLAHSAPARADGPAPCPFALAQRNLCAALTWTTNPTEDDFAEFALRFWNPAQATSAGPYLSPTDEVRVSLWMPSMGHGSSPVKVAPAKDAAGQIIPGTYKVSEVYFVMHGSWEIWVELWKDGTRMDRAKIDYKF